MSTSLGFGHKALLSLDPEKAHHLAIRYLKARQKVYFDFLGGGLETTKSFSLKAFPNLKFHSRVGLAAGFDKNAEVFPAMAMEGFGFVEVGTVTPLPQPGNPKPRIFRLKEKKALVNSLGFNNVGLKEFRENLIRNRKRVRALPVFANIGKGIATPVEEAARDYKQGLTDLAGHVDGFVINVSSPNTPGLRKLQSVEFFDSLDLPEQIPVLLKLAPDLENTEIEALAEYVSTNAKIRGLVMTNTSRALAESLAKSEKGGLSGEPLFQRSLECVRIARKKLGLEKALIGVGGIHSGRTAREMLDAGADLIEVYTGYIYQGPALIREIRSQTE